MQPPCDPPGPHFSALDTKNCSLKAAAHFDGMSLVPVFKWRVRGRLSISRSKSRSHPFLYAYVHTYIPIYIHAFLNAGKYFLLSCFSVLFLLLRTRLTKAVNNKTKKILSILVTDADDSRRIQNRCFASQLRPFEKYSANAEKNQQMYNFIVTAAAQLSIFCNFCAH